MYYYELLLIKQIWGTEDFLFIHSLIHFAINHIKIHMQYTRNL